MFDTIARAGERLRAGETTSAALVAASLDAIAARAATLNVFVSVDAAGARAAASAADRARAAGVDLGPLHGVPISLKDLIDQAGRVTTAASHVLDDRVATADALVVSRLTAAGAIIIGRTNLHQFALGTTSDDSAYGPVRNPHDAMRVAGGSSGGSAVAVASGMGLASVGTDTGASIRVPAAVCGVVGLKPSFGDVPTDGVIPLSTTLDHVGPITRSVQDAAWMWQAMSGRPFTDIVPLPATRLRLGALGGYFTELLDDHVRDAFERAMARLAGAGVSIEPVVLPDTAAIGRTYADIVLSEAAHWHRRYLDTRRDGYQPAVHARISQGLSVPAVDYIEALAATVRYRRDVNAALAHVDALVLPTLPIVAPPVGAAEIAVDAAQPALPVRAVMLRLTQLFNLTGHPAMSLPMPSSGLPTGLQLVGRRHDTLGLLSVAAACEPLLAPHSHPA